MLGVKRRLSKTKEITQKKFLLQSVHDNLNNIKTKRERIKYGFSIFSMRSGDEEIMSLDRSFLRVVEDPLYQKATEFRNID